MAKPPPHDLEAEAALIGSMIYWPDTTEKILGLVEAEDFYHPANALAFECVESLFWDGKPITATAVIAHLKAAGHEVTPGWRTATERGSYDATYPKQAEIVIAHRMRRDLTLALDEARGQLPDLKVHPGDVAERLSERLSRLDQPAADLPDGCMPLGEFIAQDDEKLDPWVIPDLMRRGWRAIVVAGEGAGKSTLFRQFALWAAAGKHPLKFTPMDPIRVLLVDLENPPGSVVRSLRRWAQNLPELDHERVLVWARNGGMDLLSRTDRRELEAVVLRHRPELVLLGPLYKAYEPTGRDSGEERDAVATQRVLDRLRTRYGFALMIEHHAPHGSGQKRDMRPIGSSAWMRWPDLGFGLTRQKKDNWHPLNVDRWRTERDDSGWPARLDKGQGVPWVGAWAKKQDDIDQGRF